MNRTVCLPRLSLATLIVVRANLGCGLDAYFDDFPLYAKVLLRWFHIPEAWILSIYGAAAGGHVRRLPRGDDLPDQARLIMRAMRLTDDLCVEIEASIVGSRWTAFCGKFLNAEPAAAAAVKGFASDWVWPMARTAIISRSLKPAGELLAVCSPSISGPWRDVWAGVLGRDGVGLFAWPVPIGRGWSVLVNCWWSVRIVASAVAAVARQGVRSARPRKSAALAIELVDPARMGGRISDSDHWIDGKKLRRQDVLFYALGEQRAFLRRQGVDFDGEVAALAAKGYQIVELYRLSFSFESLREIIGVLFELPAFSGGGSACMGSVAQGMWRSYLAYLPFFDHYAPSNWAHTLCPNGRAGLRLDSGVITGLCRRRGGRSIGFQNRLVYDTFEFDFDCYDLYLAWGADWWNSWRPLLRRVNRVVEVGCSNLAEFGSRGKDQARTVVIFTHELNSNHNSASYNFRLLRACCALARRHPQCRFVVKMKDPQDVDILLEDFDFRQECESLPNFSFARLKRHDCSELLAQSDIVIAAAYTTPGSDALLAGKRAIFYSELGGGCEALTAIPGVVAESLPDLEAYFDLALDSLDRHDSDRERLLRGLDPFRDGAARDRIIETLLEVRSL